MSLHRLVNETNRAYLAVLFLALFLIPTPRSHGIGTEFNDMTGWRVSSGTAEVRKGIVTLEESRIRKFGEIRHRTTLDLDQYPVMEIRSTRGIYQVYIADTFGQQEELQYLLLGKRIKRGVARFFLKDLTSWKGRHNVEIVIRTRKGVKLDYLRFIAAGEPVSRPVIIPPVSTYNVLRVSPPPKIDGDLDEPAWQKCPSMTPFRLTDGMLPASTSTTAKMLWDDDYLYVAVKCEDHDIIATRKERDSDLWEEDVVELFVVVPNSPKHFVEFEISPRGTMMDIFNLRPYVGTINWDSKRWTCKVRVEGSIDDRTDKDQGYQIEMKIPLLDFYVQPFLPSRAKEKEKERQSRKVKLANAPKFAFDLRPEPGDVWTANLFRIDCSRSFNEYQCWSPTIVEGFHTISRFGKLVFSDKQVLE